LEAPLSKEKYFVVLAIENHEFSRKKIAILDIVCNFYEFSK